MQAHLLKTWPNFFQQLVDGKKTFEIRENDRDFHEGDLLILQEYEVGPKSYTGRVTWRIVGASVNLAIYLRIPTLTHVCMSLLPAPAVYVDEARDYGLKWWCHMFVMGQNLEMLHTIAQLLKLNHSYFQDPNPRGDHPHYDLTIRKRNAAIALGVQVTTTREWVQERRKYRTGEING